MIRWDWRLNLIWLWLGGLLGTFLLDLDHLIYTLVIYPQEETSFKAKSLLQQRQFKAMLALLISTRYERFKLSFHNALFQPIFAVFCFWVLTSTPGLLGKGLVMAMALHLLKDEFSSLFKQSDEFTRKWLFWQIKREVSFKEQKIFVVLMLLVFLGLNLLLI